MNIQSLSPTDGHPRERKAVQFLERLIQNGAANELGIAGDDLQHLVKNVRDAKSLQKIMEKFKNNAENLIEENFKDGEYAGNVQFHNENDRQPSALCS